MPTDDRTASRPPRSNAPAGHGSEPPAAAVPAPDSPAAQTSPDDGRDALPIARRLAPQGREPLFPLTWRASW